MWDENTGQEIKCIICGGEYDCQHLLAELDRTFGHCKLGYACNHYDDFENLLISHFKKALSLGNGKDHDWDIQEINHIWLESLEYSDPHTDDIYISTGYFFPLLTEIFVENGGIEYPGLIEDGGGPGSSSAIQLVYSDNPRITFEKSILTLEKMF